MAFLSFFVSLSIALPFSSAFVVPSRNTCTASVSIKRFASTLELAPTIATQQDEEAMFSDFPSLSDMEQQPVDESAAFFASNNINSVLKHIQVTEITDESATISDKPSQRAAVESSSPTYTSRASVQAASVAPKKDTNQSLVASSPKTRLMEETTGPKRRVTAKVRETGYDSMKNYLKTMCNHELLNKNEEVILAREIQILMKFEESREELEAQLLRYVLSK